MKIGLVVFMAWCVGVVGAVVVAGFHVWRRRDQRLGWALACPLGAVLSFGLVSAVIGLLEGAWTTGSAGFWVAVAIGGVGAAVALASAKRILRAGTIPGHCPSCGYLIGTLPVCPECGRGSEG